jgi:glutamate 5-kinase
LLRAARGEVIGTLLVANKTPLAARKQWLADHLRVTGSVVLDDGAVEALRNGKSLLPIGVRSVDGDFERGSVISCLDRHNREMARGLANYNRSETGKICGKASHEIEGILGYLDEPELIHRDNLVLI